MFAPTQTVTLDDGTSIELGDAYAKGPLALIFLRHFGCIFCREIVARMRASAEANILFVGSERAAECAAFRARMDSPHRIVSDPGRSLYTAFELGRADWSGVINVRSVARGVAAMRMGVFQGRPTGDPLSLGGAFVIDCNGTVVWEHRANDVSDNPTSEAILQALARAERAEVKSYPFAGIAQR